jgi:hypothetical protein
MENTRRHAILGRTKRTVNFHIGGMSGKICLPEGMLCTRKIMRLHNRQGMQNPNNRQSPRPFASFPRSWHVYGVCGECIGCAGSRISAKPQNTSNSLKIQRIATDTKTDKHGRAT